MSVSFASTGDLAEKKISFTEFGKDVWAYSAEGDPNTGVVIGDESVLVFDAQATPAMAQRVIEKIRTVTDKPIKHLRLSHYLAVRVLGASAYGASEIIASEKTRAMIDERRKEDWDATLLSINVNSADIDSYGAQFLAKSKRARRWGEPLPVSRSKVATASFIMHRVGRQACNRSSPSLVRAASFTSGWTDFLDIADESRRIRTGEKNG